jgi:urease accessory protein
MQVHRRGTFTARPFDLVVLDHEERHVRRKRLALEHEGSVMVDFPQTIVLEHGDALVLEDSRLVEVVAAEEELLEITGHSAAELSQLAWHIGNRHLAAQIEQYRILILRDAVIREMLLGLGAHVREVVEPFHPVRGAYSGQPHAHGHDHRHDHGHGHDHGHSHE